MKTIEYSIVDDPIIIGTYIVLSLMFNKDCTFSKDISIIGKRIFNNTDLIIIKNYDVLLRGYNMEYINNTFFDLNKK